MPEVDFLKWLNEQEGVVTTSSCSGRIAIFHGDGHAKGPFRCALGEIRHILTYF